MAKNKFLSEKNPYPSPENQMVAVSNSVTPCSYACQYTTYLVSYEILQKMNPDGHMDTSDFNDFLYGFYKDNTDKIAQHYFRAADKDRSGRVNFKEFLLFLNHECTSNHQERLEWMFDLFDIDGNGTIERSEMIKIYKVLYCCGRIFNYSRFFPFLPFLTPFWILVHLSTFW